MERVVGLEVVPGAAAAFDGLVLSLFLPLPASSSQTDVSGGVSLQQTCYLLFSRQYLRSRDTWHCWSPELSQNNPTQGTLGGAWWRLLLLGEPDCC